MTNLDSDLKAANKAADILIAEALKLKEQRDDLLKALEHIALFDKYEPAGPAVQIALDAIAKAKS